MKQAIAHLLKRFENTTLSTEDYQTTVRDIMYNIDQLIEQHTISNSINKHTVKVKHSNKSELSHDDNSTDLPSYPNLIICNCGPNESCPKCKETKLAAGIGTKFDSGKLRYSLIPPAATKALAEVLTFGAQKYAANSWQNVPNAEERYLDALMRHLEAYRSGEIIDPDSNLPHMAHILCNAAFLMHFEQERRTDG